MRGFPMSKATEQRSEQEKFHLTPEASCQDRQVNTNSPGRLRRCQLLASRCEEVLFSTDQQQHKDEPTEQQHESIPVAPERILLSGSPHLWSPTRLLPAN